MNDISEQYETKNDQAAIGQADPLVMPVATGYVSYDVMVNCPICKQNIYLNQYPYNDDETDFSLTDDELGLAVFGTESKPATWGQFEIEYKCCKCKKSFLLTGIEI